jgi:prepilin-type N-terminal cleavage/methylation domain-containing protein/prepilin-type processing-associated H-X9-DG protein
MLHVSEIAGYTRVPDMVRCHQRMLDRRSGFTLLELLVVVTIIGVLAVFTLAAIQGSRASAARLSCANNLKQIGLGLQNHQTVNWTFPPQTPRPSYLYGSTYGYEGMSWHVFILPYIERARMWDNIVAAYKANTDPFSLPHAGLRDVVIPQYICPADGRLGQARPYMANVNLSFTSYVGMTGYSSDFKSGLFGSGKGLSPASVTDGLSNTVAVGERPPPDSFSLGWWYTMHNLGKIPQSANDYEVPADGGSSYVDAGCNGEAASWANPPGSSLNFFSQGTTQNECDSTHYWSLHPGGANFLFVDGSVKFLRYSAASQLRLLATVSGGEQVGEF